MSKLKSENREWFGQWFDSPYYHILYKHRDHEEARAFIDNLVKYLDIKPDEKIMDLACGKGRHAIYLNSKGFDVVGLDLSPQSISFASQFANDSLHFAVHDMRKIWMKDCFNYVFNLFTSFGYFESKDENQQAINAASLALKPGGRLLIDFLNPYIVVNQLVKEEVKIVEGIQFHISRKVTSDDYIEKSISFVDKGKSFEFKERVKAIRRVEFLEYFEKADLKLIKIFGDYELNEYVAEQSERMIFLLSK